MAKVIGSFGYNVDVVNYADDRAVSRIKDKYDLIVDIRVRPAGFWSANMNEGCKTVVYLTGSSPEFAYERERERLADLERRRGVKLKVRRTNWNLNPEVSIQLEKADAVWFIGNEYNLRTFSNYRLPPVSLIRNNGYSFTWLKKDIVRDKRNFLFFASSGQVHKGLDLLLEIFGREGFEYNLYICSIFMDEEDFCEAYKHELFERPNIFPVGWVDINGPAFREVTEICAYTLMPSCSEGCAGSVLTAMSAGVIPIISRECGVDGESVVYLPDCRIETIEQYIKEYAEKPDEWIRERSRQCVEDINTLYSEECFRRSVHDAMSALLKK